MALRILHSDVFLRSVGLFQRALTSERSFSTAAEPLISADSSAPPTSGAEAPATSRTDTHTFSPFRTNEDNPVNHTTDHLARYYTVPKDVCKTLYSHGGLSRQFETLAHAFTETSIMVRKPFLELKDSISNIDFSKPVVRFVLYSPPGCGKSLTLAHTIHYGHSAGYLLVHVPWVSTFMKRAREVSESELKPGMWDVPLDASMWLNHFKTQNSDLIQKLNLTTSKTYDWNARESTPVGTPLLDLVQYGQTRAKYACGVIEVLLEEIKALSTQGRLRTMVVIDGFNGLLAPGIVNSRRMFVKGQCTMAQPFLDVTTYDWRNGVVIVSVDPVAHWQTYKATNYLPHYLLGKKGWELLDPFIPIKVEGYTKDEMESALDYYIDRKWLLLPEASKEEGRVELAALSGGNPFQLMRVCAPL